MDLSSKILSIILAMIQIALGTEEHRRLAGDIARHVSSSLKLHQATLILPNARALSGFSSSLVTEILNEFPTTVLNLDSADETSRYPVRRWPPSAGLGLLLIELRSVDEEALLQLADKLSGHNRVRPNSRLLVFLVAEQPRHNVEAVVEQLRNIGYPRVALLEIVCALNSRALNPTFKSAEVRLHKYHPMKREYTVTIDFAGEIFDEDEIVKERDDYEAKQLLLELNEEEVEVAELQRYFFNLLVLFGNIVGFAIFLTYLSQYLHLNEDYVRIYNVSIVAA